MPAAAMPTPTAAPLSAPVVAQTSSPFSPASAETLSRLGKPAAVAAPITGGAGAVKVGEAKRVPLTRTEDAAFVPSASSVAPPDASTPVYASGITPPSGALAAPEVALPPSQNTAKTLWAEIGKFADAAKALSFWDSYRHSHPDFPVVRVRVTQSYVEKMRGNDKVSLRVGPFAKRASLTYLCNSAVAPEVWRDLECREVTDMGISSAPTAGGRMPMGEANAARAIQQSTVIGAQYWLQLGAFPSMAQAQNAWSDLKQKHGASLGGSPSISTPAMNSSGTPSYRLRSGPYATQTEAMAACNKVKNTGGNCLVSAN